MDNRNITRCSETGAMVFSPSPDFLEQQAKFTKLQEENDSMKTLLTALLQAQSASVKSKLPQELLEQFKSE
jgi:hypothetical protein